MFGVSCALITIGWSLQASVEWWIFETMKAQCLVSGCVVVLLSFGQVKLDTGCLEGDDEELTIFAQARRRIIIFLVSADGVWLKSMTRNSTSVGSWVYDDAGRCVQSDGVLTGGVLSIVPRVCKLRPVIYHQSAAAIEEDLGSRREEDIYNATSGCCYLMESGLPPIATADSILAG